MKIKILLSAVVLMILSACGSGGVSVYVSGQNGSTAVYWQDGTQHNLDNSGIAASASGIVVDSGNIYVSGTCSDVHNEKACYWKNGTVTILKSKDADDYRETWGRGISVANNNIYVAGYVNYNGTGVYGRAAYWIDNTASCTEISDATAPADAKSIFVSNGHIYVGGMENHNGYTGYEEAVYWDNDSRVLVASNGYIQAISASGSQIYTAGYETDVDHNIAIYYIGTQKQTLDLPADSTSSSASGIYVSGTDVYVSGQYYASNGWVPCYWKNGVRVDLAISSTTDGDYPYTSGIFVKNGDVYVSGGYMSVTSRKKIACYWKNGVKTDLTFVVEKENATSTGIFVE
ncbi:MAG: hypothetical protein WCQ47_03485 [bacterium]